MRKNYFKLTAIVTILFIFATAFVAVSQRKTLQLRRLD
ncbi:hypothetical protein M918_19820 [Clostridium sp. BL8]|nr:hypothetical protein M918_19820 [Clostridium sp. BL8]